MLCRIVKILLAIFFLFHLLLLLPILYDSNINNEHEYQPFAFSTPNQTHHFDIHQALTTLYQTTTHLLETFSSDILLSNTARTLHLELNPLWTDYPYAPIPYTPAHSARPTYCASTPQLAAQCRLEDAFHTIQGEVISISKKLLAGLRDHARILGILDKRIPPTLLKGLLETKEDVDASRGRGIERQGHNPITTYILTQYHTYILTALLSTYRTELNTELARLQDLHTSILSLQTLIRTVEEEVRGIIEEPTSDSEVRGGGNEEEGEEEGQYTATMKSKRALLHLWRSHHRSPSNHQPFASSILTLFSTLSDHHITNRISALFQDVAKEGDREEGEITGVSLEGWEVWCERTRDNWGRIGVLRGVLEAQMEGVRRMLEG